MRHSGTTADNYYTVYALIGKRMLMSNDRRKNAVDMCTQIHKMNNAIPAVELVPLDLNPPQDEADLINFQGIPFTIVKTLKNSTTAPM